MQSPRPSLMQRALGVFVLLAFALGLFLWAGRTFVQRHIESVHLDTQRLAALRTFEKAIVPLQSLPNYSQPTADIVREQFRFCADPLKEKYRDSVPVRERRTNVCASTSAPEEMACYLRAINGKLNEMGGDGRTDRDRTLAQIYVVSVERWMDAIRLAQNQPLPGAAVPERTPDKHDVVSCNDELGAARQLASNDGRLLGQLAWRDLTASRQVDNEFMHGQVVKVSQRILEQRNPWGGIPGCIYYGDAGSDSSPAPGNKLWFVSDKRESNRFACMAMRPAGTQEKDVTAVTRPRAGDEPGARDPAWTLPESLDTILADMDNVRLPWKDLYRAYTEEPLIAHAAGNASLAIAKPHGPNELERQKHKVEAGFNVHLTIQPEEQRVVQQVSKCYAGDADACSMLGLDDDRKFAEYTRQMYEHAAVRMAAVAVIDVATGRIEALGSAHTDCYRQEYDGPGRNAGECPDLPTVPHYEPDRLLDHALYTDALPASTIKPIMAVGFLHDPAYRKKIMADRVAGDFTRMQDELKSSDSAAFLDRMFCKDLAWANCQRPHLIQDAAVLMGWDPGCLEPSFRCGRLDVLFGLPSTSRIRKDTGRTPLGASVIYGRLLTEPAVAASPVDFQLMHDFTFDGALAAGCSRGEHYFGSGQNPAWRKCRQGHFSSLEHEGWGQGNARATTIGEAGMVARLAAAANGQTTQRLPYLVDRITDARSETFNLAARQFHLGDPVEVKVPQTDAAFILQGMVSHKARGVPAGTRTGTANGACIRVYDATTCNKIDWVAGKTGTPPYGNDDMTLAAIHRKCSSKPGKESSGSEQQEWQVSCSSERPYKWYIAVFQTEAGAPGFNKAIAVLTERNWHKSGPLAGKVQSPGDHDEMNVSAEMAFRIMDRLHKSPPAAVAANTVTK